MIPSGGFVFHLPRVKSGISTGLPLPATLLHAGADDRAPGGRVVDVLVERLALAQGLDEPVVLDVVHAAVAPPLALRGDGLPERVLELGGELLEIVPFVGLGRLALDVDPVGPLVGQARACPGRG